MLTSTIKSIEPVTWTKTQPIKSWKIPIHYPYIICSSVEHRCGEFPKKIEVQNMFRTKHVSSIVTTTPKPLKLDNVLINVLVVVTARN